MQKKNSVSNIHNILKTPSTDSSSKRKSSNVYSTSSLITSPKKNQYGQTNQIMQKKQIPPKVYKEGMSNAQTANKYSSNDESTAKSKVVSQYGSMQSSILIVPEELEEFHRIYKQESCQPTCDTKFTEFEINN